MTPAEYEAEITRLGQEIQRLHQEGARAAELLGRARPVIQAARALRDAHGLRPMSAATRALFVALEEAA